MQQITLPEPKPEEVASEAEAKVAEWFSGLPFAPDGAEWLWLTPARSKELWRLSGYFRRRFDFGGEWFGASRDRPAYIAAFRQRVLAAAPSGRPVYVLHGPDTAAFTSVGGFLDCWPRLRLLEVEDGYRGYDVLPLDLAFWFQIVPTGTAHIAYRSA